MGNKVPWKIGVLIYLPVTSRPLISLQKEAVLSAYNFATTHLAACILNFYLPSTSRTLSQRPDHFIKIAFFFHDSLLGISGDKATAKMGQMSWEAAGLGN